MENTSLAFLTTSSRKSLGEGGAAAPSAVIDSANGSAGTDRQKGGFGAFLKELLSSRGSDQEGAQAFFAAAPHASQSLALHLRQSAGEAAIDAGKGGGLLSLANASAEIVAEATEGDADGQFAAIAGENAFVDGGVKSSGSGIETVITPAAKNAVLKNEAGAQPLAADNAESATEPSLELGANPRDEASGEQIFTVRKPATQQSAGLAAITASPGGVANTEQIIADSTFGAAEADSDLSSIDRSATARGEQTASIEARTATASPVRDQIVAAVAARTNEGRIEVRLDPPELGRVTINFESDGGELVRAVITADTPDTLDLMRRNAELFQRSLQEQGFEGLDLAFAERGAHSADSGEQRESEQSFALAGELDNEFSAPDEPGAAARLIDLGRLDRRL